MKLTYKEYLFIFVTTALLFTSVLWGIQKHRTDSLQAERALSQSLVTREKIEREYIPMRLRERRSDELTRIGANLWGE
jgi:hypothetical protein